SRLEPDGSTFATRFQEDFITSTDRWFRPVKSLVGPDGALYVADWYDHNISHTDPKDRSKWYPPSRDTGRIWRVAPVARGGPPVVKPTTGATGKLSPVVTGGPPVVKPTTGGPPVATGKLSSDDLVNLLKHPNAWYS